MTISRAKYSYRVQRSPVSTSRWCSPANKQGYIPHQAVHHWGGHRSYVLDFSGRYWPSAYNTGKEDDQKQKGY